MHAVRPVIANSGRFSVFVVREDQTVFRFAVIVDGQDELRLGFGRFGEIYDELAGFVREYCRTRIQSDAVDGEIAEVEIDRACLLQDQNVDSRADRSELGELIVERDVDEIVLGSPGVDQPLNARCEGRRNKS